MTILDRARSIVRDGAITADKVASLAAGGGVERLMLELIELAKDHARPPISGFRVGVVAEGASGALYLGANMEFAACPLDQAVHAEQAAVVNAARHGETGLRRLAASAPPCGHCRQFLYELAGAGDLHILTEDEQPIRLTDLLPHPFGPGDLGQTGGLLGQGEHGLAFVDPADGDYAPALAALGAARISYAPYTKVYGGAAILSSDGRVHSGMYLENVAFNPSLLPLQAAIVAAIQSGCEMEDFAEACIAQPADAKIDHVAAAKLVLAQVAPGVEVRTALLRGE